MFVKKNTLVGKLDAILNFILNNPELDRPHNGYSALDKKVKVLIEAPDLKFGLDACVKHLTDEFYSGTISLDYLKELAARDDIKYIHSEHRHKTPR